MGKYKEQADPSVDSSLGLVFRLNNLWADVDHYSRQNVDKWGDWDLTLDAIYQNLSYDPDTESAKIILVESNYALLTRAIMLARKAFVDKEPGSRKEWRGALQDKDKWLRQLMMGKKLYLKETKGSGDGLFGD